MAGLLPLPGSVAVLGLAILLTFASLGGFWAPAMALLSDASEETGLDQALAFSLSNLAWAAGHLIGASAGGAVAEVTSDTIPYAALGVITAVTLATLTVKGRRQLEPA